MATLTGFTRPSDPINATDLQAQIATALGKTVDSLVITPTDIQVTGSTIVSGDQSAAQTALTAYYYNYSQTGVALMDNPDMSADNHGRGVTQHAAFTADTNIAGTVGKLGSSAGLVYGAFPYIFSATTNSSGVATIYLTNDGTSGGTASFTTVYMPSISPIPVGANNYQPTAISLSPDKKTLTVTINQIAPVLGILNLSSTAPAGITVQGTLWGR